MALSPGTRLGPYEIEATLGAGGMGEVYRARDTTLNRDVAIKVLPELSALNRDRLVRFKREAQVLASLNHPNIAAIYGFAESNPSPGSGPAVVQALVLELVEGETLADRIARGPIRVDEALAIARQIAEALEASHEKGIIHRDLKPANIKIRPDGTVKVLDFGLAKAFVDAPSLGLSEAPTRTSSETREGLILGTPSYMSPEQARGETVDKRTDIWAFGGVLYEMLTERAAFARETVSETIAAILEREPNWDQLPAHTPTPIRRLLRRCLEKNPKRRLRDVGDALAEIEDAPNPHAPEQQLLPGTAFARRVRQAMMLGTFVIAAIALTAVIVLKMTATTPQSLTRFTVADPTGFYIDEAMPAVSPDGRTLVFSACVKCGEDLDDWLGYRRPLDQLQATPIPGTEGAYFFFFSPDGQSIGFTTRAALKKVSLHGGPSVTLHEGPVFGADWGPDDSILFGSPSGLMRISAAGGQPQQVTVTNGEKLHMWPAILPGGRAVLTTVWEGSPTAGTGQITVVPLDGSQERPLVKGASPRFVPTGHMMLRARGRCGRSRSTTERRR